MWRRIATLLVEGTQEEEQGFLSLPLPLQLLILQKMFSLMVSVFAPWVAVDVRLLF